MAQISIGAEWFKRQLALKGMKQGDFARLAGVSSKVLTKILAGETIRTDMAVKIVNGFNSLPDIAGMAEALEVAS